MNENSTRAVKPHTSILRKHNVSTSHNNLYLKLNTLQVQHMRLFVKVNFDIYGMSQMTYELLKLSRLIVFVFSPCLVGVRLF